MDRYSFNYLSMLADSLEKYSYISIDVNGKKGGGRKGKVKKKEKWKIRDCAFEQLFGIAGSVAIIPHANLNVQLDRNLTVH